MITTRVCLRGISSGVCGYRLKVPRANTLFLLAFSLLLFAPTLRAQPLANSAAASPTAAALPDAPQPRSLPQQVSIRTVPGDILHDQAVIWTSPARIRPRDLLWLAPLGAATGAALATDRRAMRDVVSHNINFNNASLNTSNVLVGGFVAAPVAIYGFGHFKDDAHARQAGILTGEAMVDGLIVEQGMKLIFWRERPAVDNARGRFFQSSAGADSSFPSTHCVVAWSAAATMAGEYHSRWTQLAVYSAATGVSITRVLGQEHFPSDVLVGSAAGWLIGHYVVHRHPWHWHRTH